MTHAMFSCPWPASTAAAVTVASAGRIGMRTSMAASAKMIRYVIGESVTSAVNESMNSVKVPKRSKTRSMCGLD